MAPMAPGPGNGRGSASSTSACTIHKHTCFLARSISAASMHCLWYYQVPLGRAQLAVAVAADRPP